MLSHMGGIPAPGSLLSDREWRTSVGSQTVLIAGVSRSRRSKRRCWGGCSTPGSLHGKVPDTGLEELGGNSLPRYSSHLDIVGRSCR